MEDIKNKKCITCNLKQPYFNYPEEDKPLYCSKFRLNNMVDIENKKCTNYNLTQANKNTIITVLFVLLTYTQQTREVLRL